jgi:hypothetical protein
MVARTREPSNSLLRIPDMKETLLKVYLQPKSSKNELVGPYRDGIKVKVTAPPIEGKANEALIRFLAKEIGIPPSSIEITKGHHAREKTLRILGTVVNGQFDFKRKIC